MKWLPHNQSACKTLCVLALVFLPGLSRGQSRGYDWDDIHFEAMSAVISEGFPMLTRLAELLRGHPDYKVVLTGNTANEGTFAATEKLGLARADAVKNWLVQAGVSLAQINVQSQGSFNPLVPNTTPEGRFRNRRVTILPLGPDGSRLGDGSPQATAINDFEGYMRGQGGKLDSMQGQLQELASQNYALRFDMREARAAVEQSRRDLESLRAQIQSSTPPPPDAPAWRGGMVGRRFLIGTAGEDKGFGLYSYLLIPRIPTEAEEDLRKRYVAAIDAFLTITQIETIRGWRQPDAPADTKLNITYLPLTKAPAKGADSRQLLDSLNDSRTRQFLAAMEKKHAVTGREGPFIISSEKPLSMSGPLGPHLYFDMTGAPPEVVKLYVVAFAIQSERERFWEKGREIWLTECFDFIERGGAVLGEVQKAFTRKSVLSTVLSWVK